MSKLSDLKARMEKRAYSGGQLLGDLLASGSMGLHGAMSGLRDQAKHRAANIVDPVEADRNYSLIHGEQHLADLDAAHAELLRRQSERFPGPGPATRSVVPYDPSVRDPLTEQLHAVDFMRSGIRNLDRSGPANTAAAAAAAKPHRKAEVGYAMGTVPTGGAATMASLVTPVNDHFLTTPLATMLGGFGANALMGKYAPNATPGMRGLATAGGAMAGRMALRGYDAVKERGSKKKSAPKKGKKDSEEKTSSAYELGKIAAAQELGYADTEPEAPMSPAKRALLGGLTTGGLGALGSAALYRNGMDFYNRDPSFFTRPSVGVHAAIPLGLGALGAAAGYEHGLRRHEQYQRDLRAQRHVELLRQALGSRSAEAPMT